MPGIHLYTGNRLEILTDRFVELLKSSPLPPLQKETILVQSRGMARWLAMETASRAAIWANCECPFPNTFIRSISKLLLPDIPDIALYQKEFITWHLMDILPSLVSDPHFHKVGSYIASGDDLKLYQLAYEIADLFDQYTLFRPEMILAWENGKKILPNDHEWQSILWCHLIERLRQDKHFSEFHRARLLEMLQEKLLTPGLVHDLLPPRLSVFGISSLPPYHLAILSALARHIDLYFFIMNPCQEYWFDIIADRDIVKISKKKSSSQDILHLEEGNSLLASMGHLGRDFMALLHEIDSGDQEELFTDPGASTLLSCIQQDILHLREIQDSPVLPSRDKKKILSRDMSITFQSCHSPMREIEILHDHLLEIFNVEDGEKSLEPRNILVMAPDINEYAPLIRAVFDAEITEKIPYSISDQSIERSSKYIESFFKILSVSKSRFSSVDMFELLDADAIRKRFSITDHDLTILQNWIGDTRICWGIDQEHKKKWDLPAYAENTWRAGLDRLLLGYAMPGHNRVLFENILPYDHMEGTNTDLLGIFIDFSENLFCLAEKLQEPHTLGEWSTLLLQTKKDFLLADYQSETEDRFLHQALLGLEELQSMTSFNRSLRIDVIRSFLHKTLEQQYNASASNSGFLTGSITFSSMLPMRAIPFKVIYLLGMNDGSYPRPGQKKSFDLMALEPRRGDRSRRYDDRYLFLETLLSVRKRFYISFVGQSVQDGSKRPPSVLVSELMDYIEKGYTIENQDDSSIGIINHLTTQHRLQPFHPDYFRQSAETHHKKLFSYSTENCDAARALASKQQSISPVLTSPLPAPCNDYRKVEINDLVRFFAHPVRYLLLRRIGIAPIEESKVINTSEPFVVKGLDRYVLENEILEQISTGCDYDTLYHLKKASGQLPHGRMGEVYFAQTVSAVQAFHKTIGQLVAGHKVHQQEVDIEVDNFKITGRLDSLTSIGMVQYRFAILKPKDMIRSWINHLILNRIQLSESDESLKITILAGKDKIYKYLPVAGNSSYLEQLLSIYWQGLSEPLHFFPQASFAFADAVKKGKTEHEAVLRANSAWEGNIYTGQGEKYDPYNSLCFKNTGLAGDVFIDLAKSVFLPLLEHQTQFKL